MEGTVLVFVKYYLACQKSDRFGKKYFSREVASVMVVWYVKVVSVMVHVVVVVCDGSGPGKCVPKCSLCW